MKREDRGRLNQFNLLQSMFLPIFCATCSGAMLGLSSVLENPEQRIVIWILGMLLLLLIAIGGRLVWPNTFILGFFLNLVAYHWLPGVIARFSEFPWVISSLIAFALISYEAMQFVLWGWLNRKISCLNNVRTFSLPLAWVLIAWVFPKLIPWTLVAPLVDVPCLAQFARLLGVTGLCFIVLFWVQLFGESIKRMKLGDSWSRITWPLAVISLSVVFVITFGLWSIKQLERDEREAWKMNMGVVQGNLDPIIDFRPEKLTDNLSRYRRLSAELLQSVQEDGENIILDALLWPESSVGITYAEGQQSIVRGSEADPFPGLDLPIFFGAQAKAKHDIDGKPAYFSSVHLLDPSGVFSGHYYKQYLFPFSEREIGFSSWLFPRSYKLSSGQDQRPLKLRVPRESRVAVLGVVICFEDLFPTVFRDLFREQEISAFIVFSNDNWFSDSVAQEQHLWLSRWRGIEFGRSLLRVTNNGQTALIDPQGQLLESLVPFSEQKGVFSVPVLHGRTIYSKIGEFGVLTVIAAFIVCWILVSRLFRAIGSSCP